MDFEVPLAEEDEPYEAYPLEPLRSSRTVRKANLCRLLDRDSRRFRSRWRGRRWTLCPFSSASARELR